MSQDDLKSIKNRTSSPSLSERVRSFTTLRSRVPSTARAASTDGADTETDANVDSDDGLISPERIRSDPGVYRDEQIAQYLDSTQPLRQRIKVVERISRAARLYQVSSLISTWKLISDFAAPEAPLEARKAVFALAQASIIRPELTTEGKKLVFSAVTRPIDSQHLELQAKCLRYLTDKGRKLDGVSEDVVTYIKVTMEKQCEALFETRKRYKSSVSDRKKGQLPEERGLYSLLSLGRDVIENTPQALPREDQATVLDHVLVIAEKTTSREDMKRAVSVLGAFVKSFEVPGSHITSIVEILCAISSAISGLSDEIRDPLLRILQSDQKSRVVKLLLQTLALSPQDRHTHTVCGALYVLRLLVENKGDHNLPPVSFATFTESFWHVHFASRRIRRDCLRTIASLLDKSNLVDEILHSNWQYLVETILTATGDEIYVPDQSQPLSIRQQPPSDHQSASPTSESSHDKAAADEIFELLKQIAASFNTLWLRLSYNQQLLVARFHFELQLVLPSESIGNLILIMAQSDFLWPDLEGWEARQKLLVRQMLLGRHVDSKIYSHALTTLGTGLSKGLLPTEAAMMHYWGIAKTLLNDFPISQRGWQAAAALAKLVVKFWVFDCPQTPEILTLFKPLFHAEPDVDSEVDLDEAARSAAQLRLGGVTEALVDLFVQKLNQDSKAVTAQLHLLLIHEVVSKKELPGVVRLPALRLLTHLRSDQLGAVFVIRDVDTFALAAALNRTEATMLAPRARYDRSSVAAESAPDTRKSRTSAYGASTSNSRGSAPRFSVGHNKLPPNAPLWTYPDSPALPRKPPTCPRKSVWGESSENPDDHNLKISEWLLALIQILQDETDWEVYSYVIVHLPSQLCNLTLCSLSMPVLKHLRRVIVGQLREGTFHEPPTDTDVKKGDVALCLVHSLVILLGYCELFEDRAELDDMIRAFLAVAGAWEGSAKTCIQALTTCCHVLPSAVSRRLPEILQKMSQIITQSQLAMDVLDFLGTLARLPHLYADFREDEFRMVFAICVKYLEHSRERRNKLVSYPSTGRDRSANRTSEVSTGSSSTADSGPNVDSHKDLPQYVFALAYHVLTIWFLSLKLGDRHRHVGWITKNLTWIDEDGEEKMDEQSQVTLDMMLRATYTNLNETSPNLGFTRAGVQKATWLAGLSIVTVETVVETGLTQLTKRQASGTTHAIYQPNTSPLPPHHVPLPEHFFDRPHGSQALPNVFPNHVFLQLGGATAAPTPTPMEPIHLPDDDVVTRALASFDRNDTVDGYKVAVIYIKNGQKNEVEILGNSKQNEAFQTLLEGLGTKVKLKGATFNTQGLDKVDDSDGTHTYAWRDRVVEIVYHVPTLMPTNVDDEFCVNKKRHVGNDLVKVIFNESGYPFNFDTFPTQFNFINIVITPEHKFYPHPNGFNAYKGKPSLISLPHYTVQLQLHPSLPQISSSASMKMVPLSALGALVRQLALSSSVFCNVWCHRGDVEYVGSSWRNRLREILRLRERYANSGTSTSVKYPGTKGQKTYAAGDAFAGRVQMGGIAEEEGVSVGLDFSRWAGAPPSLG
ncbi:Tuberous sclerosis 2-like protein [Thelotrema lepadinum]|nr:Tuberous sclerosis 2-like protein [Thelotrema lepadinum]